jgi:hypothetical protein
MVVHASPMVADITPLAMEVTMLALAVVRTRAVRIKTAEPETATASTSRMVHETCNQSLAVQIKKCPEFSTSGAFSFGVTL